MGAGSLGEHRRQVADLIAPRLTNTLILAGVAALVAVPLALVLGLLAALYRNGIFDRAVNLVTLTAISSPEFFLAYVLMLFLAVRWPLFHALSSVSADTSPLEHLQRIALPALTLVLVIVAHMMRMTRPRSSTCWPALTSRWRGSKACRRPGSSSAMPCLTPGRRSPT